MKFNEGTYSQVLHGHSPESEGLLQTRALAPPCLTESRPCQELPAGGGALVLSGIWVSGLTVDVPVMRLSER